MGKRGAIMVLLLLSLPASLVWALTPVQMLQELNEYPHARLITSSDEAVIDHEVGLGSIKKIRGVWRFKKSERRSGQLLSYTWQIVDGFSSEEVMEGLLQSVEQTEGVSALFACNGRSCGQSAQWANRVFGQRLLYGREDLQRYRVFSVPGKEGAEYRLVVYSAARSADRQYLHVELLSIKD